MSTQIFVILFGLALAAWGHLLLHRLFGAHTAWAWLDNLFPAAWRTPPSLAGGTLLVVGACLVVGPVLG